MIITSFKNYASRPPSYVAHSLKYPTLLILWLCQDLQSTDLSTFHCPLISMISSVSTLPNLSFMIHHFNPWDKSSTFLLPFPSVLLNQKNTTPSEISLQTPYLHPRSGMQPNRHWNCTDSYLNFGAMSLTWALSDPYYMSQVNSQILG